MGKSSRRESQKKEVNRAVLLFTKKKYFSHVSFTEVVGSLKRSGPGFSANIPVKTNKHGKQNLQVFAAVDC